MRRISPMQISALGKDPDAELQQAFDDFAYGVEKLREPVEPDWTADMERRMNKGDAFAAFHNAVQITRALREKSIDIF